MASGTVVRAACPHDCPDTCAMLVTVEDGRAVAVRGDPEHPFTRGGLCVKVNNYEQRVSSSDRVLYPLKRSGPKGTSQFGRVSWDEALETIRERWTGIVDTFGPTAILPYSYLGTEGILNGLNVGDAFFNKLGATISERTFCDSGSCTAYFMTIGPSPGMDPESFKHSKYIILWACNTISTNLHHWPFIAEAKNNGAKLVVIDPVKTRTAREADWHIPIRPGTDAALAMGMMNVIVSEDLDDRFHETDHGTGNLLADSSFVVDRTRSGIMAGWRQAVALAMTGEEIEALTALSRSRTEPAGRVSRAAMLLGYREKPSFFAVGRRLGVHHQTVQRCVERAMAYGALAALDDRPRPGKEPTITPEAKAWLVSLACDKAKEHGYPHELWTTRLLARHARERGPAAGHQCLARLAQGTVCKLLGQEEIKPHKVRYYLERRDAEFEPKMAEVLCVYREVQVLKKAAAKAEKSNKPVAIVSYDEKPGIQAIATTAPDLPPVPGRHASFARDHEYKRHGTLSLLAGIDLLTGKVHALVRERHRSREFIEFLKLLDAAYPASTAIKLILDNHSAHISRETRAWLDTRPPGRFDFTFTPKHGSWLNLIEGFFSKFARSVLRHIRVTSKQELKDRIMAAIDDVNRHPVVHTWSYRLEDAA